MKCVLFVLVLSFTAFSATGVQHPDNREGTGFVAIGAPITAIGTSVLLLGGGIALLGDDMHGKNERIGVMILSVGAGIDCVGVPLLTIGVKKRERARFGIMLPPNRDGIGLSMSLSL